MSKIKSITLLLLLFALFSFAGSGTKSIKCLIQMSNYEGEGAYVIVSILNSKNQYVKTVYVNGDDNEWYYELSSWWKFYGRKKTKLDGITGGTISGGQRAMKVLKINSTYIDKGYKLRFESAVEAKNYYPDDIEFSLTTANLTKKHNGKGFVRYVRMLPK